MKPLQENIPFPSLEGITKDLQSAKIIRSAYASLCVSEMTASSQYMYHYFYFDTVYDKYEIAETVENIAIAEMIHIEYLGKALIKLGVDPIYSITPPYRNYYNTSQIAYSNTPQRMLMDDIKAEMNAIEDYEKMLKMLRNDKVAALIERIQLDEKLHLREFNRLLEIVNDKMGHYNNYNKM